MYELIEKFPDQLRHALALSKNAGIGRMAQIENVVICGLGGSGIGGNVVNELTLNSLHVPLTVVKDYTLPAFVSEKSLVILCSYSGNTEEVLSAGQQLAEKGIKPYCVSSGGALSAYATENNCSLLTIPSGFPPRTCFGYSLVSLLHILSVNGLYDAGYSSDMEKVAELLEEQRAAIQENTAQIAKHLNGKVVVALSDVNFESVALRFKQQLNENSKSYCWHNVFPEMNHNELVSWRNYRADFAVILFRNGFENKRNQIRMTYSLEEISKCCSFIHEEKAIGKTHLQQLFYSVNWGDWVSYYLALEQGFDPMEIDVLVRLKNHLAAIA